MLAHVELYPKSMTPWGRDLNEVHRGRLTFDELFRRHKGYVTKLAKKWVGLCPPYMSPDDFRQEIWATVAAALEDYDPNHPKKVPLSGWIGWRVGKRMGRIAEKHKRSDPTVNAPRYMDYLIVEERVLTQSALRDEGMLMEPSRVELVTQPSWERQYDARTKMIAAVSAMPNARASTMIAKVINGALVKEAAPSVYGKLRRPNKAAHRAIAQARAAVAEVDSPTLTQAEPENDNPEQETQLKPLCKVRRADAREGNQALASRG